MTPMAVTPDATGVSAIRSVAGQLADGRTIEAITLASAHGVSARILTYGATMQSLVVPDADGVLSDVILGHDDVAQYEGSRGYLGVTVGRYANRIARGSFTLDGKHYALSRNDGETTLHGGVEGFDRAVWTIANVTSGDTASVVLRHVSPDGEGGFPGEVTTYVTYVLQRTGDLRITFEASTTRSTIINLTNHALFNLAADDAMQDAMLHRLTIPAAAFVPVDADQIPTGELRPVAGTAFDFQRGRVIGKSLRDGREAQLVIGRGYDHTFVLDKGVTAEPQFAARLEEPRSGRRLDVFSTEPGLQLYTGNSFDGRICGKRGRLYRMGDGVALEPQKFPDTPNRPRFGSARVDPGQVYRHVMIYRFSAVR